MTGAPDRKIRHILCGVDGSDPACRAAEHAAWLAVAVGADLTFLAVARQARSDPDLDSYRQAEGLGEEPVAIATDEAVRCLAVAQDCASALGHDKSTRLIRIGAVAQTLLSVATETGADTLVLGRHDHSALRRTVVGSVSRTLAANSRLTLVQVW